MNATIISSEFCCIPFLWITSQDKFFFLSLLFLRSLCCALSHSTFVSFPEKLLNTLVYFNQIWQKNVGGSIVLTSFVKINGWADNREFSYPCRDTWLVGGFACISCPLSLEFTSGFLLPRHVRQKMGHKERNWKNIGVYCKHFGGKMKLGRE